MLSSESTLTLVGLQVEADKCFFKSPHRMLRRVLYYVMLVSCQSFQRLASFTDSDNEEINCRRRTLHIKKQTINKSFLTGKMRGHSGCHEL